MTEDTASRIVQMHNSFPDLIEALKETMELMSIVSFWERNYDDASIMAVHDNINKAIAKAEGNQPRE